MADVESANQLPKGSLDELVDFFDSQDMGDHLDSLPEVQFDVDIRRRRHFVEIDEGLISELARIAEAQRVSAEELVDAWLREKIATAA